MNYHRRLINEITIETARYDQCPRHARRPRKVVMKRIRRLARLSFMALNGTAKENRG